MNLYVKFQFCKIVFPAPFSLNVHNALKIIIYPYPLQVVWKLAKKINVELFQINPALTHRL